eukprot:GHVU01082962.1.p1 GENE.GHVU01082962.1~~GHVU01082962.1.p1  ORF type:complete len:552 (-),score=62.36 GHVU01082962.1:71-1726(-)
MRIHRGSFTSLHHASLAEWDQKRILLWKSLIIHSAAMESSSAAMQSTASHPKVMQLNEIIVELGKIMFVCVVEGREEEDTMIIPEELLECSTRLTREFALRQGKDFTALMVDAKEEQTKQLQEMAAARDGGDTTTAEKPNGKKRRRSSSLWDVFHVVTKALVVVLSGLSVTRNPNEWAQFVVKNEQGVACGAYFKVNPSSGCWRHLQSRHPDEYKRLRNATDGNFPPLPEDSRLGIDRTLALWIARRCRPINCLADPELGDAFDQASRGTYKIPSPYKVRQLLKGMYAETVSAARAIISSILAAKRKMAIAADVWSKGGVSLLGIVGYVIVPDAGTFTVREILLAAIPFGRKRHTALNIRDETDKALSVFGICRSGGPTGGSAETSEEPSVAEDVDRDDEVAIRDVVVAISRRGSDFDSDESRHRCQPQATESECSVGYLAEDLSDDEDIAEAVQALAEEAIDEVEGNECNNGNSVQENMDESIASEPNHAVDERPSSRCDDEADTDTVADGSAWRSFGRSDRCYFVYDSCVIFICMCIADGHRFWCLSPC